MNENADLSPVCCQKFDPKLWDDKTFIWENKKFIKDKVFSLFYMPMNFGQVMKRLDTFVSQAGASVPEWLCLSDHTTKWNIDVYLAVDKDIPGANNTSKSGKYFCKVYEGPFKNTGIWMKDFENIVKSKGFNKNNILLWYTTCPKCAKKYGKNYVAIFSKIE